MQGSRDQLRVTLDGIELSSLQGILDLHGPFVLATEAGQAFLSDVSSFRRTPIQVDTFRLAAADIAFAASDERLVSLSAGEFVREVAIEFGRGEQPARSAVIGSRGMTNLVTTLMAGAALYIGGTALAGWAETFVVG